MTQNYYSYHKQLTKVFAVVFKYSVVWDIISNLSKASNKNQKLTKIIFVFWFDSDLYDFAFIEDAIVFAHKPDKSKQVNE